MRITVTVPDEIGKEVKRCTENVSAYVSEALEARLREEKRRQARRELLEMAGHGYADHSIHEINQRERRESDRAFDADGPCTK